MQVVGVGCDVWSVPARYIGGDVVSSGVFCVIVVEIARYLRRVLARYLRRVLYPLSKDEIGKLKEDIPRFRNSGNRVLRSKLDLPS